MTPVYQTIIGRGDGNGPLGNCMQAVIASLLDLPLEEVPHFLLWGNRWYLCFEEFLLSKGYEDYGYIWNNYRVGHIGEDELRGIKSLPLENCGVKGYFYAAVYSPGFFNAEEFCENPFLSPTHAVIIDNKFNIVHDPNPNYKIGETKYPFSNCMGGYNGVIGIHMISNLYE